MANNFSPVSDASSLEQLFERSNAEPVLLFKHSNSCPISARAYRQMQEVKTPVAIIVVQDGRDLSREVATRTGVRHETPQALVLRNGRAVWAASHFDISADDVERAVRENA
ncbi:MAG TPA: bacillithiol system redox-active protein YtxJ [Pyrinomonadaceae bacterium]|jgi:bacillithiol system protein YtxJ|nr:bacillithiol system redox-active protein YtxJ [Pyrinomonadaceae bacterium]